MRNLVYLLAGLVLMAGQGWAEMKSSVTQWGITWTFDKAYECGQFVNGDWWVLGPVSIISIDPVSQDLNGRWINGACLNWGGNGEGALSGGLSSSYAGYGPAAQGFDSYTQSTGTVLRYEASRNLDPGKTGTALEVDEGTVFKSIYKPVPDAEARPTINDMAVMTVVTAIPPAGAFRPAASGTNKASNWNEADLDLTVLPNVVKPASAPAAAAILSRIQRIQQIGSLDGNGARNLYAAHNQENYGARVARDMATAALLLCCDIPQTEKRDLAIALVQVGIDVYGRALDGGVWYDMGGLYCGFKLPLVVAAVLLRDNGMLAWANAAQHNIFAEDRQMFYVQQSNVGQVVLTTDGRPRETYLPIDLGMPEWGEQAIKQPIRNGRNLGAYYRDINTVWQMGYVMAGHLMNGAQAVWGCPALFDYCDRLEDWMLGLTGSNAPTQFHKDLWTTYRSSYGCTYTGVDTLTYERQYDCSACIYNCPIRITDTPRRETRAWRIKIH